MKLFPYKQFLFFLTSVFILIGSIVFALFQVPHLEKNVKWVNHTQLIINQLGSLVLNISESESNGLGYILTNNEMFLVNYNKTIILVNKNLKEVMDQLNYGPVQKREIEKLRLLVNGKIDLQDEAILLKKDHTLTPQQLAINYNLGRLYLESIKAEIVMMEHEEQLFLEKRQEITNHNIILTMYGVLFSFIFTFIVGFYLILFIRRYIKEQRELESKLVELNENKNKFFSIISHDLRGPVNNIVKLSEFIKEEISEEERIKLSNMIETSIKKVNDLLNNLLKWAIIQMNAIKIISELVFPQKLVEENIAILNEMAKSKNIQFMNHVNPDVTVWADYNMINTVIRNLISNAIKFTGTGGQITITADKKDEKTFISVKDNGIGMSRETLANLFKQEKKAAGIGTADETGSGLGLQICKEFIEKNHGVLSVESEIDLGSIFTFALWAKEPLTGQKKNMGFIKKIFKRRNKK